MSKQAVPGDERIFCALVEALGVKDYDDVTVGELLRRSGANKSTFYYHFANLDDVVYKLMERFMGHVREGFARLENVTEVDSELAHDVLSATVSYVWDHQDVFQAILHSGLRLEFEQRLRRAIVEECSRREVVVPGAGGEALFSERELDMCLEGYAAMIVGMLVWLADNGFEESPEHFSELLMEFARGMGGESSHGLRPRA